MTTNSKKRSVEELDPDSSQEPPSKKAKLDLGESILEQSKNDFKDASKITLDEIQKLFAINTQDFDDRYQVYQHFQNLSLALIRDLILIFPSKKKMYRFVEFEFYCVDGMHHNDVFAHCDDIQLTTNASWYFHRGGNASVEGYNFMTNRNIDNKKWVNPNPTAKYRGGTFKGCDITFGGSNAQFGGILIRSMQELKPLNSAFTNNNDDCVVYSPSDIIEGPCKCVNNMLKQTGFDSINALTESKSFSSNIFGDDNNAMFVDLARKYTIKQISPKRKNKNNACADDSKTSEFDYDEYFYNSPRVGLTLKKEKRLKGKELERFQKIKKEFVMAPYRCIRSSALSKIKRYKACIALSIMCRNYHYSKLNNTASDKVCYENASMLYNKKQLDNLVKQCQDGKKCSAATIKDAEKKFPTNNNGLAKLFGALL